MTYVYSVLMTVMAGLLVILHAGMDVVSWHFFWGWLSVGVISPVIVKYLRGQIDIFDPLFLFSMWVFAFIFISPTYQVYWDFWPFLPSMSGDLNWITLWAFLNFICVCVFLSFLKLSHRERRFTAVYLFKPSKFVKYFACAMVLSFVVQLYIYYKFGGVAGFVAAFSERQEVGLEEYDPFSGYGVLMLIAESFKVLIAIFVIVLARAKGKLKTDLAFVGVMLVFFVVFLFFGGLRGSRSSTLFSLFFAAGMFHFYIRPISKKLIVVGALGFFIFSSAYYWYKIAGAQGVEAIFDSSARQDFHSDRVDSQKYLIVRDLGRMDIQSLALKRYLDDGYEYSFGRTYLVSIFASIPKQIIPYSPDQITKEKTDIIYGPDRYIPGGIRQTTLVMGLFGEALVNFGVAGVILAYAGLGWFAGYVQSMMRGLHSDDVRRLLLPFLSLIVVLMLITDMNVVLYQLSRYLAFPIVVSLLCVKGYRLIQPRAK